MQWLTVFYSNMCKLNALENSNEEYTPDHNDKYEMLMDAFIM